MQFVYSPYDYEQMQQYQQQQYQRQRQYQLQQQQLQQQAIEEYYQQQLQQQMQQQKQKELQQKQKKLQEQKQEHAQQLFDYMYMQQLQQQEAVRQQQQQQQKQQKNAAKRAASLEKVRVAEINRQKALKAAQEADAERQAALEEIARYEQEEAEHARQAKLAEQKRAEQKRVEAEKAAKAKAEAEAKAAAKAKAEADAKAKAEAAKQAEETRLAKEAEDKARVAALKQQRLADVQAKKQAQLAEKPKPVQSEAEAFADYYSQLTGCPGNGPSFAQALKQLGVNVNYESDDDTAAEEDTERPTQVDLTEPKQVPQVTTPISNASTDVEDDEDVQDDNSEVHPLVAFLQSLGIPATISEPQVAHAFNQEDPDLALADFVESLSDDEKPSEASKKATKAAKRAAKAQAEAAKAQAEADAAEEELKQEKLLKKQKRAAKKARKAASKAQAPATPSKPLPSVVVYSSPQSTEQDTVKQLAKISATVDRSVETYERIKRAATQSDSEYSNSVSSYNSRIKVIQQAQIKLESAYDELDSMTVSTADEKKERTRLIRRAVSTAEAIDPIVEQLKTEKSKIEKTVTSSDEEEIPRKVTIKNKNKNAGSPVRKVTLETVPDADSASE